ncbi:hypothetical protein [Kutzneria sp. CA-103260]|uniref:hypothetical protein n=1 Tax=Kutzneria sp. CA-103260 TaxID=2802641 RepID=UPI001BA43E8F|nr:hypothetical protein [Kutzneria sp. CA-103260]
MTTGQQETEQQQRANRALTHFHFCLGFLSVGDVSGANDYLKDVEARDGWQMYRSVCDMIAVHTGVPPLES